MDNGFISDDDMATLESGSAPASTTSATPSFISDADFAKLGHGASGSWDTPLTAGENVAAGTGKLLNSLTFNFGDEANAGINSLLDSVFHGGDVSTNYGSRLSQIRDLDKRYSAENPLASTALGLGGLLTPIPDGIFSEAKGVLPALGNVAKGAGLGSIYGGLYGAGEGEGSADRLSKGGVGALVGATLGAPLQAAVEGYSGLKNGLSAIKNFISPDLEGDAANIATDTISQYTDPAALVQKIDNLPAQTPLTANMTTAEQVRDPGLGLLTKVLENKIPEVGITKEALDAQRATERNKIFTDPQGVLYSPEQTGNLLQKALGQGQDAVTENVNNAYDVAKIGDGTAPIFPAKKAISRTLSQMESNGIPVDATTQKIIDNFRQLPNHLTLEQLSNQRQIVGSLLGDLRSSSSASPEQKAGSRALAQLFGHIDDAEKFALTPEARGTLADGTKKGFSAQQGQYIQEARDLATQKGELFKSGTTGKILDTDRYGKLTMQGSDVPRNAISGPEDARQVMQALKVKTIQSDPTLDGADAQNALASNLMETLRDKSTNPVSGRFTASAYARNWDKMEPIAAEVLRPDQIKAIKTVRNDLVGEANFNASVGNASKGQSVSSQNLGAAAFVKDSIAQAARSKIGVAGKLLRSIGEGRSEVIQSKVDEILTQMSFDPKFTKAFLSRPTPQNVQSLTNNVLLKLAGPGADETVLQSQQPRPSTGKSSGTKNQKLTLPQIGQGIGKRSSLISSVLGISNMKNTDPSSLFEDGKPTKALLDAVKNTEWNGKGSGVSSAGAMGPYQLMPDVAKAHNVTDPFDEPTARKAAAAELAQNYKLTGDPALAVLAYNHGIGNVLKDIELLGTKDPKIIVAYLNKIGNTESAQYVGKVFNNLA